MVNNIILGSAQFGMDYGVTNKTGKISDKEAVKIIEYARLHNIVTIDTAISYGSSEKVLGDITQGLDFDFITKLPKLSNIDNFSNYPKTIKPLIKRSLENLKIDSLKGVLFHYGEDILSDLGKLFFEELLSLKQDGLIEKIGVSLYDYEKLLTIINNYHIDIVQAPLNVFDRRFLKIQDVFIKHEIEFHSRSVFLQGLLLQKPNEIPKKFSKYIDYFIKWNAYCDREKIEKIAGCTKFIFQQEMVTNLLFGVSSIKELKEIVHTISYLSELKEIDFSLNLHKSDLSLINPSSW